jgi:membrane protease YdiL (CAAX protease family)
MVLLAVAFEGGLGLLALLVGWLIGRPCWDTVHLQAQAAAWGAAASLPMLAVFVLCIVVPAGPLVRIKQISMEVIRPLFVPCTVLDLAVVSVMAGIGEELLFRGFVQAGLSDWLNPWAGLAGASLLFGLLHPITPTYVVLATSMGAYLGYVWTATGNLLVVIIAHALYDFLALLYLVRGSPGVARTVVDDLVAGPDDIG